MLDELRRVALFGSGVAELTRHQAEQVVKDLIKAGDLRRQQLSGATRELLERNRENRLEIIKLVRREIQNQIESLGLATKRDVQRLERRVARLEGTKKSTKKTTRKTTRAGGAKTGGRDSSTS